MFRTMNRHGKAAAWTIAILAMTVTALAGLDSSNPYQRIAGRNVFALRPTIPLEAHTGTPPPPAIRLQGVMSLFGVRQALINVQPRQPGDVEKFFVFSEGQRLEEIEALAIDVERGSARLDNHGLVQTLTLVNVPAPAPSLQGEQKKNSTLVTFKTPLPEHTTVRDPVPSAIPLDEQAIMIEVERERTRAEVEAGLLPPLPPTPITPGVPSGDVNAAAR